MRHLWGFTRVTFSSGRLVVKVRVELIQSSYLPWWASSASRYVQSQNGLQGYRQMVHCTGPAGAVRLAAPLPIFISCLAALRNPEMRNGVGAWEVPVSQGGECNSKKHSGYRGGQIRARGDKRMGWESMPTRWLSLDLAGWWWWLFSSLPGWLMGWGPFPYVSLSCPHPHNNHLCFESNSN